jgi:hypothetical protein
MQYEDDRLYCLSCEEQTDEFLELVGEHASLVTPNGSLIDPDIELFHVTGYRCGKCEGPAKWGADLSGRLKRTSR